MQKRYTGSDTRTNKYCVFAWPCWCCWCCCSSLCFLSGRQASDSSSLSLSLSLSVSAFGFQFSVFSWRTSAAFPIHFLSQEKGESVERERERERGGEEAAWCWCLHSACCHSATLDLGVCACVRGNPRWIQSCFFIEIRRPLLQVAGLLRSQLCLIRCKFASR